MRKRLIKRRKRRNRKRRKKIMEGEVRIGREGAGELGEDQTRIEGETGRHEEG